MRRTSTTWILAAATTTSCFKDEGTTSGAGDATATTTTSSTSLAPTTSGTSGPTAELGGPDETTSSTTGGATSTGTTEVGTSEMSTTEITTTTGVPPAECGDGIIEEGELCDDGPDNADDALCTSMCTKAKCSDGLLQPILGEECDFGMLNNNNGACLESCKKAKCGDDFVFYGVEECDKGEANQADLYGGCTPMTCTLGPRCGDNEVQKPFEECDHGDKNGTDGDVCTTSCALDGNVVFVTTKIYTGLIGAGGIKAVDDQCNTLAMEAGLPNAGAFKAWISDGSASPSGWNPKPEGPFLLLDGTSIAHDWPDLIDGQLTAMVSIAEDGLPIGDYKFAWTGTSFQGLPLLSQDCLKWTNETKDAHGAWGNLESINKGWTNYTLAVCQDSARVICIEQ